MHTRSNDIRVPAQEGPSGTQPINCRRRNPGLSIPTCGTASPQHRVKFLPVVVGSNDDVSRAMSIPQDLHRAREVRTRSNPVNLVFHFRMSW